MILHTYKSGDDLYSIAKKYSTNPAKIMNDNGLTGDRINTGEQLLILIPTKTVRARLGDTSASIANKYGIKESALIIANPVLTERSPRPGEIITVKQNDMKIGVGSGVARCHPKRRKNLTRILPFITYLIVDSMRIGNEGVSKYASGADVSAACRRAGKLPILGVRDNTYGKFIESSEGKDNIISSLIEVARAEGYAGISIDAPEAAKREDEFLEFILTARKKLLGCDLILFTDIYRDTPPDASELSDGGILHLDDSNIGDTLTSLSDFSAKAESSKVFVELSVGANLGERSITAEDAMLLCRRSGGAVYTDDVSLISFFDHRTYKAGLGRTERVSFPSLGYTKAKLEAIAELGFMGICFDTELITQARLSMFSALFARGDYAIP